MTEIKNFSTKELVEELRKREGVKAIDVSTPDDEYFISTTEGENDEIEESGPAIILIITD